MADRSARGGRIPAPRHIGRPAWGRDRRTKVQGRAGKLPEDPGGFADDLADGAGADRGEFASEVLCEGKREPLDLVGGAGELGPEILALRGDAGGARVEMALA